MTRIIALCISIALLFLPQRLHAGSPYIEGDQASIENYVFNEGTSWMFGTTMDVRRASIGENIVGVVVTSSASLTKNYIFQGFLSLRLHVPPVPPDYEYDIDFINAEEYQGGLPIGAGIWFYDSDPYFYWSIKSPGPDVVGYSIAFDELPDEFVDVAGSEYQTPDFYLSDGKHTFYVVAKNTEGSFGAPGGFDIWVDTVRPVITNTLPENGKTVNQLRPAIEGTLFDATSGIDESAIVFTITTDLDEYTVSGTYDEETGLAAFIPVEDFPDGLVTVRFEVTDKAGNEAVPLFWSFTVDTSKPEGWILINSDAPVTDLQAVTLNLFATEVVTEVTEMIVSNDGIFDEEEWEIYKTVIEDWDLPFIAGTRTVYVKFRDSAGNESQVYSDAIVFVMIEPNTFITEAPQSVTTAVAASFAYTATISESKFQYKLDDDEWTDFTEEIAALFEELEEGNHYFQVRAGIDLNNNGTIEEYEIDPSPAIVSWTIGTLSTIPFEAKQPIRYYKKE
ncbi:MAG: Ig-like domain repeat protein [Candidatus Omnitrophica bacterium]|nr:Ig-like domain repeat protein [Candidatus Omnitrophota bacterium]